MIYWTAADNWGTTNSRKHNYRREKHNYWFLQFLTEIYQLSDANCVEYPWELKFTGHYTKRNFRQNQNNLSALILKAFILPDGSAWLVTYFCIKQDQKRFLNQNRHEQILVPLQLFAQKWQKCGDFNLPVCSPSCVFAMLNNRTSAKHFFCLSKHASLSWQVFLNLINI